MGKEKTANEELQQPLIEQATTKKAKKIKVDESNPPKEGSPEGKKKVKPQVSSASVQDQATPKEQVVKAAAECLEEEEVVSNGLGIKDYAMFLLRLIAVGIIIAAFLSTYMNNFSDVNVVIEDVAHIHRHPTRFVSKLVGFVSDIYLPPILRTVVIRTMGTMFGVNFSEVLYPLEHFTSWNQFFGRQIIPRPISKTAYSLVAPADSVLLSLQEIHQDSTVLVKGINYSVGNFITGEYNRTFTQKEIDFFRMKKNTKLFSLVFYLAPKDYHRFHSMANCTIFEMVHVAGLLFPVKDSYVTKIKGVYEVNERVLLKGEWKWGNLIQSYIGATNVGNIEIKFDKTVQQKKQEGPTMSSQIVGEDLSAGEEVGRFLMGSSVVSIVEVPKDFVWDVKQGDTVKYGQRIGH